MRFHVGCSFRPSLSWVKWILLIVGGVFAFFGIGNHVVLAATLSATPSSTYAYSPYGATQVCASSNNCWSVSSGSYINDQNASCYNQTWDGTSYCAFNHYTNNHSLGHNNMIQNARLRWTYDTSSMNKCSSGEFITYKFDYYLKSVTSGSVPGGWSEKGLYKKFWIRSSQTNYDCNILNKDQNIISVSCTIPNPTANVYVYIEGLTLPFNNILVDGYYNFGIKAIEYSCGDSIDASINNLTTALQQGNQEIINNQNENTEKITDKLEKKCSNIYNFNNGNTYSVTATHDDHDFYIQNMIHLQGGKTYYFKWKSNKPVGISGDTSEILLLKDGGYSTIFFINDTKDAVLNVTESGDYQIRFDCNKNGSTCTLYDVMVSETNDSYCKFGSSTSLFDSNNQIIQGQQDINSSINDSNVGGATGAGRSFFNTFQSSSTTGLSGIITSPIRMFQAMLDGGVCQPLNLTLSMSDGSHNGQNFLSLPCGDILWGGAPSAVVSIYHIIIFGLVGYRLLIDMVRFINSCVDPEDSKEYIMDL